MVRPHLIPIVIAGPTASGKSKLALSLCKKYSGEIICADSRQFYRGMAIGTASPTSDELLAIPHHGYGTLDPKSAKLDAGYFVNFALEAIREIQHRGKRPILVGGTGLYLRSLYYGLSDVKPADEIYRRELVRRMNSDGLPQLYEELKRHDRTTADALSPNDAYRIMRALEIFHSTGQTASELRKSFNQGPPQIVAHWLYKKPNKDDLIKNIEDRVKIMFTDGLIEEAKALRNHLPLGHWALDVMGYKEALDFSDGKLDLNQAIERTFIRHRQYARRQFTWFNKENFYRFTIS